ncbi:synaptotagmin-like protein 2 isoform 2-T2 [Pelodytes ibericus]
MKNSTGNTLDLSFLTDEEYEKLLNVLQRDAELQKKDGDRIRRIQGSLKDEKKKKFMTGAWFRDVKAKRFQEDLQGSDLLRASIKKKKNPAQNNGTVDAIKQDRQRLSSSAKPVVDCENQSVGNGDSETYTAASQPQTEASFLRQPSEKTKNLAEVSPEDHVDGLNLSNPNIASDMWNLHKNEKRAVPPHPSIHLPDSDRNATKSSISIDSSSKRKPPVPERRSPKDESGSLSKIPVIRKSSKEAGRPEVGLHLSQPESSAKKTDTSGHSSISSPEPDFGKDLKNGPSFVVQSMKDKTEQETVVDQEQFRSLKNFWQKAAEAPGGVPSSSDTELAEVNNSPQPSVKPSRLASFQYNTKTPTEERPDIPSRIKHFSQRASAVSSSEDELVHVSPPRKGSSSMIPRSTYGKSKGSPISKSVSLSESNGTSSPGEESSGVSRSPKKSKLPVRVPSISMEDKMDSPSPTRDEKLPSIPQAEVEEIIVPEAKPEVKESLFSKVKILIDAVSSDEEQDAADAERRSGGKMEPASSDIGRDAAEHPEANAPSETGSVGSAKSMVNIYTSTETYSKPQPSSQQLLEPERAKELSRSTPALLSETESDTASEISFQLRRHRKTHSNGSNSSDMASVSSVSNSVLSVYSGDFGSVDAQGTVEFSLDYDEKNREFQIFVAQCKDLAVVDEKKLRSDPYVKTYLLPDKARMGKRKTSVKRKTTNPVYNEVLRYKIDKMVLLIQKLNLSVWHNDPLGRNSFLGEMEIDLTSWDWSNTKPNWYTLKPRSLSAMNGVDHLGVMNLSIKYIPPGSLGPKQPISGEVHIWVKDTKDLPQLRPSGVDSFVKCYVLPDTSKKSYQKTRVIKKDSNPVFNHTIVYDGFHTEDLQNACVELTVWDHEKFSNHFLGGIRLGLGTGLSYMISVDWMDSTQEEVALWQDMMHNPNEWIEGSLPLRSLAGKRKLK